MRHINMYGGFVVVASLVLATVAHAEVAGITDKSECLGADVDSIVALKGYLSGATPATDHFDSIKNRYVFCIANNSKAWVTDSATLTNSLSYPVVIHSLILDSSEASPNMPLLTIAGTGGIALQNLKAQGLKAPILLQDKTTLLDSTVSCDAANTAPGITVSSNNTTFRKVTINECASGIDLTGSFNNFYEVAITKFVSEDGSNRGDTAIASNGSVNSFIQNTLAGYTYGIKVNGNKTKIIKGTLDGTKGAVVIAHDPITDKAFQPVTGINC